MTLFVTGSRLYFKKARFLSYETLICEAVSAREGFSEDFLFYEKSYGFTALPEDSPLCLCLEHHLLIGTNHEIVDDYLCMRR